MLKFRLFVIITLAVLCVACKTVPKNQKTAANGQVVQEVLAHIDESSAIQLAERKESERSVYVQVVNYADKVVSLTKPIRTALIERGYDVVDSPNDAHFVMQIKVLQVGKNDEQDLRVALQKGYGKPLTENQKPLAEKTDPSNATPSVDYWLAKTEAEAREAFYSMIIDLDLSEKGAHHPSQHYQTRMISSTDQPNQEFKPAELALENTIVHSVAEMFYEEVPGKNLRSTA